MRFTLRTLIAFQIQRGPHGNPSNSTPFVMEKFGPARQRANTHGKAGTDGAASLGAKGSWLAVKTYTLSV